MNYRDRRRGGYNKPPMDDYSGRLSNVNPWQNGVQPGDQRGSPSANSILPNLSEQAKLLLANNIINTILKPEQNQISSLLNQNVGNPLGMNNYGPRNNYMGGNNFPSNNLGMGNYSGNDFHRNYQRHEPYQKTSIRNRLSAGPNQSLNEKRKFLSNRSDNSSDKGRLHKSKPFFKPTPKVIKLSKEASFKSKGQERDNKSSKRDDSEDVEKKRDWKDEKKSEKKSEGEEPEESKDEEKIKELDEVKDEKEEEDEEFINEDKPEKEDDDKDIEEKMEVVSDKDEKEKSDTKNEDSIKEKSKDTDSNIINKYLVCHICNKTMWDERSWNNHLNGKSHKSMMAELEITYRAKIDLMRHEMKIIEQKRQLLHEKRTGQRLVASQYCVMCELRFGGNIAAHRKSDRHQKLRKFLHPNCEFCKKEFRNRLEWELHRLTLTHIRKYAEKMEKIPKSKNKGKASKKGEKDNDSENKDDDNEIEMIDNDKSNDGYITIDEANEENEKKDSKLTVPKYKENVVYGKNMISSTTASYCKCCDFVFKSSDIDRHCKSKRHYNLFVKQHVAEAKDSKKTDDEEIIELDDEGNWKRRKIIEEEYKKFEKHLMNIDSIENSQDNSQETSALELNDSSMLTTSKTDQTNDETKEDDATNLAEKEEEEEEEENDWDIKKLDELIEEVEEKIGEKSESEDKEPEKEEKEPENEEKETKKEEKEPEKEENEKEEEPVSNLPMKTRESTNKAKRGRKIN